MVNDSQALVPGETGTVTLYEQAKNVLAEYTAVDDVKEFRDKATALEHYAKQANDLELEHDAARARCRAERRVGELLKDMEKAQGGKERLRSNESTAIDKPKTLEDLGISKNQSSQWQKAAEIPEEEFNEAIEFPGAKPSISNVLKLRQPEFEHAPPDRDAMKFWSALKHLNREGFFEMNPSELFPKMTDNMWQESTTLFQKLQDWSEQCRNNH